MVYKKKKHHHKARWMEFGVAKILIITENVDYLDQSHVSYPLSSPPQ